MLKSESLKIITGGREFTVDIQDDYVHLHDPDSVVTMPLHVFQCLVDATGFGRIDVINGLTEYFLNDDV